MAMSGHTREAIPISETGSLPHGVMNTDSTTAVSEKLHKTIQEEGLELLAALLLTPTLQC